MLRAHGPSFSSACPELFVGPHFRQELVLIHLAIFSSSATSGARRGDETAACILPDGLRLAPPRREAGRPSAHLRRRGCSRGLRVTGSASLGGKRGASRLFLLLRANIIEPFSHPTHRPLAAQESCTWRPPPLPLPASARLTTTQWLIVVLAAIGFAFDIYELLMAQFVLPPAIPELTGLKPGTPEFGDWVGRLFYIPAFAGGIFGLLGGYLTDLLGRRRVLTWSILLYAVSAFLAGFSTSIEMLLVLRCTTFIGVCVEFVAAVAWLAELFPEPRRRESVLGYTQAFSSLGGLLVAGANTLALKYADQLPAVAVPEFLTSIAGAIAPAHQHEGWRYTLMSGLIPALPLILIRPFLPESPVWAAKKAAGTLKRPSVARAVRPAVSADDDRYHVDVRLQLRCGLWSDPANAANRSRRTRGQGGRRGQTGAGAKEDRPAVRRHGGNDPRDRRTGRPGAAWRFWPFGLSAAGNCFACSSGPT